MYYKLSCIFFLLRLRVFKSFCKVVVGRSRKWIQPIVKPDLVKWWRFNYFFVFVLSFFSLKVNQMCSKSLKDVEMSLLSSVGIIMLKNFNIKLARSGAENHCKSAPLQALLRSWTHRWMELFLLLFFHQYKTLLFFLFQRLLVWQTASVRTKLVVNFRVHLPFWSIYRVKRLVTGK